MSRDELGTIGAQSFRLLINGQSCKGMLDQNKTADSEGSNEHYLDHLASINKNRDVVAIEDIYGHL